MWSSDFMAFEKSALMPPLIDEGQERMYAVEGACCEAVLLFCGTARIFM